MLCNECIVPNELISCEKCEQLHFRGNGNEKVRSHPDSHDRTRLYAHLVIQGYDPTLECQRVDQVLASGDKAQKCS